MQTEAMQDPRELPAGLPRWVNQMCLHETLTNTMDDVRKLQSYEIVPVTKKGDLPALLRLRCTVELMDHSTSTRTLLLKTALERQTPTKFAEALNKLQNECQFYDLFAPAFAEILASVKFTPERLHLQSVGPLLSMYFADLDSAGYEQVDPTEGMNWQHTQAVLRKLGALHAASVVSNQRGMQCLAEQCAGPWSASTKAHWVARSPAILESFSAVMDKFLQNDYRRFLQFMPTATQFANALARLCDKEGEVADFNVLNHGELWCRNIHFKRADNEISDVIFSNYHLCQYGPPTYDLYFVIITSITWELKRKLCLFNYLREYQTSLRQHLQLLKYKGRIPSVQDLDQMMHEARFFAFLLTVTYLPLVLMPSSRRYGLEDLMDSDEVLQEIMHNKEFIQEMKTIFPVMCSSGYMNF